MQSAEALTNGSANTPVKLLRLTDESVHHGQFGDNYQSNETRSGEILAGKAWSVIPFT